MPDISIETAQRLAAAWGVSDSLEHACRLAGIQTKDRRNMNRYRRQAEDMLGIQLPSLQPERCSYVPQDTHHYQLDHEYTAVIFSDAHFWPHQTGPAFWVLLDVLMDLQPEIVIDNGDSLDGSRISRHDPNTWDELPTLREEYDCTTDHLAMIQEAAGEADLYRNIGNHDLRLEAKLTKVAPEFKDMPGTTVSELFPEWRHQYSVMLNGELFVKHRWHGGIHAAYNNTLKSGVSIATGHTHRLTIREFTDLRGIRYGIETGTLAQPFAPQFRYAEDNPRNWQNGFVVVDIDESGIHPELVRVIDGKARFRGKVYKG